MDWNKEASALREGGESIWKPQAGAYEIEFLDNGTENTFEWEGETIHKVRFKVKIDNERDIKEWNVTKGETINSLYGQIVIIGKHRGTLVGTKIGLLASGKGKDMKYTIPDAIKLLNQPTVKEELVG